MNIVAVEAKNIYNLGEGLSEEMVLRIPAIVQKIRELLRECLCPKRP
jgi:hypothetical protein